MISLKRTDSNNPDFINLVKKLDAYLKIIDGDEHKFYNQFNTINTLKHVIIAYNNSIAVGCGAIKNHDLGVMEIKRMFVDPTQRSQGIGAKILHELELWAKELGVKKCILETGNRMTDAVLLYKKNNYSVTPNYGQYKGVENSICFEKDL